MRLFAVILGLCIQSCFWMAEAMAQQKFRLSAPLDGIECMTVNKGYFDGDSYSLEVDETKNDGKARIVLRNDDWGGPHYQDSTVVMEFVKLENGCRVKLKDLAPHGEKGEVKLEFDALPPYEADRPVDARFEIKTEKYVYKPENAEFKCGVGKYLVKSLVACKFIPPSIELEEDRRVRQEQRKELDERNDFLDGLQEIVDQKKNGKKVPLAK